MRVNIYSQELTSEVKLISKESDGRVVTGIPCFPNGKPNGQPRRALDPLQLSLWEGAGRPSIMAGLTNPILDIHEQSVVYHAVQLMLHSSPRLHHPPEDDDRSAVTLWLPRSQARREDLAQALEEMASLVRSAPPDTGLD